MRKTVGGGGEGRSARRLSLSRRERAGSGGGVKGWAVDGRGK